MQVRQRHQREAGLRLQPRETNDNSDSIKLQWLELETRVKKYRDARIEACKAEYQVYQELLDFEREHGDRALTLAGDLLQEVKDEVKDIFDEAASLIRRGENEEAKLILQSINLHRMNGTPGNLTLLHVAAEAGNEEMTRHLIELGSDVEAKTRFGLTPLKLAVEKKYASVVEILLKERKCTANDIDETKLNIKNDNKDALRTWYQIINRKVGDFVLSSEGQAFIRKVEKDVSYVPKRVKKLPRKS